MLHRITDGQFLSRRNWARKSCSCQSGKNEVKIQRRFLTGPNVKGFVHDEKAHFIGQFQQFRRRWIVAGADGVAPHLRQHFQLPLQRAIV